MVDHGTADTRYRCRCRRCGLARRLTAAAEAAGTPLPLRVPDGPTLEVLEHLAQGASLRRACAEAGTSTRGLRGRRYRDPAFDAAVVAAARLGGNVTLGPCQRMSPDDPRHGTANGYANLGCRCDECRGAWRRKCARWERERAGRDDIPHGTRTGYENWRCRCDPCTRAMGYDPDGARVRRAELVRDITRLTERGETARRIAEILGVSVDYVRTIRRKLGIKPPPLTPSPQLLVLAPGLPRGERNRLILTAKAQGFTQAEIARRCGITRQAVSLVVKEARRHA